MQNSFTLLDIINLSASGISIILGFLAIILSFIFFMQSKKNENQTSITLEKIQIQSALLEKMTDKWLDKVTTYATTPHNESLELFLKTNPDNDPKSQLKEPISAQPDKEAISLYILIQYYSGIANISFQSYMPADIKQLDQNSRSLVDACYNDFIASANILKSITSADLESNRLYISHYKVSLETLAPLVKDTVGHYQTLAS